MNVPLPGRRSSTPVQPDDAPPARDSCFTCTGCDSFGCCTFEFEDDVKKADDDELVQWLQNHNVLARVECPIHPDAIIGDNGRCKAWVKENNNACRRAVKRFGVFEGERSRLPLGVPKTLLLVLVCRAFLRRPLDVKRLCRVADYRCLDNIERCLLRAAKARSEIPLNANKLHVDERMSDTAATIAASAPSMSRSTWQPRRLSAQMASQKRQCGCPL
jgi:hypothetical protein